MKILKKLGLAIAAATLSVSTATHAADDKISIGFTGPLSGGAALYGENTLSGLKMAVEEINASGGVKFGGKQHTLDLVSLDDRYTPAQAATNAKRLVQESKAPVVFVPHSGGVFALQDFNEKSNFLLMAYTSVPSVTEKGNKLTVRIPPTFDGYVEAFTDYAQTNQGKKLGIAGATHEYAKIWTDMITDYWKKQGGTIVVSNPMDYNKSADFYTGVSKVIAADPDVMFVGGASEPTGLVVQQARQLGYQGGFIVMDQAKIDEVAEVAGGLEMVEGAIGVMPLSVYDTKAAQDFVKRYKAKFNKVPGSEAAYNYLALNAVAKAMELAGSSDPTAIRKHLGEALKTMDDSKNPYEVVEITDDGGFVTETLLAVVEDGKIVRKPVEPKK
ncbi:ABC transporter substrate-binding protein [Allohahella marinimesophila]|uniref:ABC transporter substrate-binding protein n=1 Tax=Allohahella marinimesophila TaxID=1054972 RepID=A0ABP7NYH2_9GAMM